MTTSSKEILPKTGSQRAIAVKPAEFSASQQTMRHRILRLPAVMAQTGLARSTVYLHIKQGAFPAPINIGPNSVGWLESDLDAWFAERIANRNAMEVGHA